MQKESGRLHGSFSLGEKAEDKMNYKFGKTFHTVNRKSHFNLKSEESGRVWGLSERNDI